MPTWRVTKYNSELRDSEGSYTGDDWTSASDIGRIFGGKVLTLEEYLKVEAAYVETVMRFLEEAGLHELQVYGLELREPGGTLQLNRLDTLLYTSDIMYDGQVLRGRDISDACRLNLRELIWCKLEKKGEFYLHFGYDYYMYVGSKSESPGSLAFARLSGLFVEPFLSPYDPDFFNTGDTIAQAPS